MSILFVLKIMLDICLVFFILRD